MRFRFSNIGIFFVSLFILLTLSGALLYVWRFVGFPDEYHEELLLGMSMLSIALITVVFYQSMKIYESANVLAKNLTEDILQYSHEMFTELYRSSPVPYLVIDMRGDVVSMNIATARLFNTELNALEGINIFSFFEDDEKQKSALVPEYFKEGKSLSDIELQIHRPDGVKKWVLLSLFTFRDSNRDQRGLLTLVDITKQKQIDKAKTEFVSLASHQLRTPISGMKWNIELLLTAGKDKFDTVQTEYIQKISHGVERMEMLIDDFLHASKFELGALEPEYSEVDIASFLHTVHDELAQIAKEKGVRIETDFDENLGVMNTDSHMLHSIVGNLISNAIKYTPSGGVVRCKVVLNENRFVFTISDTGIGIPKEDQEMIFSKMFRASNARTKVTDGTGLGLYIVKESVEVLGGKISFVSEQDKGTEFTVSLPA
jgi:PAS domain S-box-containing protein